MSVFKPIDSSSGFFEKKLLPLPLTTLNGQYLKYTKADRTDLSNRPFGNLFSSFNLPMTVQQIQNFTTGGIYDNTAFQYLNVDKIIVVEIPKNSYGEQIDGKNIALTVPNGTGSTVMYSTFFKNSILDTSGQLIYSDPNQYSFEFGSPYNIQELPGQAGSKTPLSGYSSNVAFLFSDSIQKPANNSNYTWYSSNKYFTTQTNLPTGVVGSKFAANYSSSDGLVDIPVGIVYLDKGFAVITHPTIVNNFNYSTALYNNAPYIGDSNFTNIYFTGNTSNLTFNSFNTEFIQHAVCLALPSEFYQSNNPTFVEAYGVDNLDNNPVAVTEIGLYNANQELIAIAKTNVPIPKDKASALTFDITIKI